MDKKELVSRATTAIFAVVILLGGMNPAMAVEREAGLCRITVTANPASPGFVSEAGELRVVATAHYMEGPAAEVKLWAENLPSFAYGWEPGLDTCGNCDVSGTVRFRPGYCDAGRYHIRFIAKAKGSPDLADTLDYDLIVLDQDRPCAVVVKGDDSVAVGNTISFPVEVRDADFDCRGAEAIAWDYSGYPFQHGAVLTSGTLTREFIWTPAVSDTGVHTASFAVESGTSQCDGSVKIIVRALSPACAEKAPEIRREPRFTPGTSNAITYRPQCGAYDHQVCYFDSLAPDRIMGCRTPEMRKSAGGDGLVTVVIDGLEDGKKYGYFVTAYFLEYPDSFSFSARVYSTQDASPPESVTTTAVTALFGGAVRISWYGVLDRVSMVNRYELFRKEDGGAYTLLATIPAAPDNDHTSRYEFHDSVVGGTGLVEGRRYHYLVEAIDTVGNRGGGIESPAVIPDATPPCIPKVDVPYDFRFVFTSYVKGVNCRAWGISNCPGIAAAHYIRFQAVRDSLKFFDSRWGEGYSFFESEWIPYNPDSTQYQFSFLPPSGDSAYVDGHRYYIRAQAKDSLGNISFRGHPDSLWSRPDSVYMDALPPGDIGNLEATAGLDFRDSSSIITLTWQAAQDLSSGLKQYLIYRKIGDDEAYSQIARTYAPSYVDHDVDTDSREAACYQIGSADNVGNIRDNLHTSWEACVRPNLGPVITAACDAVIEGRCYCGHDMTAVCWPEYDRTGVKSYLMECDGKRYSQEKGDTTCGLVPLPADGEHAIRVRVLFDNGTLSTWSNTITVTRDMTPPNPIDTLWVDSLRSREGSVVICWDQPYDATGMGRYRVFRAEGDGPFVPLRHVPATYFPDSDRSRTVYQIYRYMVHPIDLLDNEQTEGNAEVATYCQRPPQIDSITIADGIITLRWKRALPNLSQDWLDTILVRRETVDSGVAEVARLAVVKTDSCLFSAVAHGPGYYSFQVKEIPRDLAGGLSSAWSHSEGIAFDYAPAPVESLVVQPQPVLPADRNLPKGKMQLAWTYGQRSFLGGFVVDRFCNGRRDTTFWVYPSGDPITVVLDSTAWADSLYMYCVVAEDNHRLISDSRCATGAICPIWVYTPSVIPFEPPYFRSDSLTVSWQWRDGDCDSSGSTAGAAICRVEVSRGLDFAGPDTRTGDWVSCDRRQAKIDIRSLVDAGNKTLYCRVQAQDRWQNMSPWSDAYCEPETIIYDDIDPSPARGLTLRTRADSSATPGIIDVSLSWQPATDVGSGVAEYRIYRDSSDGRWQLVGRTDITRLVDDSLAVFGLASNVYRYTVHPVDGVGNEQKSQEQIEYLQIVPCPDSVWASSKQYLSWNGVDLVDAFFAECSYDRVYLGTAWMNNLPDAARAFISSPDSGSCHFLTDMNFVSHSVIYFHVKAIKGSDESAWSEVVTFGEGGVASSDGNAVPREFELSQNYPNPFNPVTRIIFRLPEAGRVALRIFNIKGELVRTLVDRDLPAGEYSLDWDSSDESGRAVASGVYFYQIRAGQMSAARKMLLVR